jgi:multidrug efflux pump subunit AcrA (membrane-fusion protein)
MTLQPGALPAPPTAPPEPNGQPALEKATNGQPSSPLPSKLPRPNRWSTNVKLAAIAGIVLFAGVVVGGPLLLFGGANRNRADLIYHKVTHGNLQLTLVERGALEAAENRDVVCRVKARNANSTVSTTIRWVVEDGTEVKKGEKLIDLDDSGLYEQLKSKKIDVDQARSAWMQAEEKYKIVISQNFSDIAKAHLDVALTTIDLEKYVKGEYLSKKLDIEGRLELARSDQAMWEERAAWSGRMSKPGRRYVTAAQAQADAARLASARLAVKNVIEEMRVLEDPNFGNKKRSIMDLQGKIDEALRALDRVKTQAEANRVTADVDRKSKKSVYDQELVRYRDIEDEIRKCLILAPQDGLVVYFVPEQSRFGSGSQQSIVAQGEPVREGQKLMRIPDLSKMVVNTRVHEAMVSRVRGEKWEKTGFTEAVQAGLLVAPGPTSRLVNQPAFQSIRERFAEQHRSVDQRKVADGQKARIRIDSYPNHEFHGHVKTVATVASQQDWLSADVKVYQTVVEIDESIPGLKPGMSAEVTIFTDSHRENALIVPLQAILGGVELGNVRKCFVKTSRGPVERDIKIGLSNAKEAEVLDGLKEGEEVVLNPRVLLSDKDKARLGEGPKLKGGKGGPGEGKGKGKGKGGPPMEGKGKGAKGGPPKGPPGDAKRD